MSDFIVGSLNTLTIYKIQKLWKIINFMRDHIFSEDSQYLGELNTAMRGGTASSAEVLRPHSLDIFDTFLVENFSLCDSWQHWPLFLFQNLSIGEAWQQWPLLMGGGKRRSRERGLQSPSTAVAALSYTVFFPSKSWIIIVKTILYISIKCCYLRCFENFF